MSLEHYKHVHGMETFRVTGIINGLTKGSQGALLMVLSKDAMDLQYGVEENMGHHMGHSGFRCFHQRKH